MSISENVMNVGSNVIQNTIKTADVSQDLVFKTTQNTVQTVNKAQDTAFKLSQNALSITDSAGKATTELVDASLVASTDIGKSGLSQGTTVAKSTMEQSAKIAVAALEVTGDTTKQTIQTAGRAATNVFSTVDNALIKSKIILDAKREANFSKTREEKKRAVIGITEQLFSTNVEQLAISLNEFIEDNRRMINKLITLLKSNKCKKGYVTSNCERNVLQFTSSIITQLENLTAFSKQNIERLKGLRKKLKGKIVQLYNLEVTDENLFDVMNGQLAILLSPYYVDASEIFERTISEFETLIEKITQSIKGQVMSEIPTTIAPLQQTLPPLAPVQQNVPALPPSDSMGQMVPYQQPMEIDGGRLKRKTRRKSKSRKSRRLKNRK
jgi:hypothetical protein